MASVSSPTLLDRVDDLRRLEGAWAEAAGGRPRLVLLAGEAGIGKSRLLRELGMVAEAQGGRALLGACLRLGDSPLPFVPIAGIVRRLNHATDEGARGALDPVRRDLAALVPSVLARGPEPVPADLTDTAARARLFEALLGLVERLAADRPLLVGIEDIHWCDPATCDLLTFLTRNLAGERLLLVLTLRTDGLARSDPVVGWLAELVRALPAERIDLERFQPDDVGRQVEAITGHAPTADSLATIWQRSEGNPYFVEELLAAGVADPSRTLAEVLLSRVALISGAARHVVRAVAVAGGPVGDRLLERTVGLDAEQLRAALREPIDAGLLRIDDAGLVRPRHALLGEVVEASLLAGERRELHEALAAAHDAAPVAAGEEAAALASARARHWLAADRPRDAYVASLDAATAASAVFAHAEAAGHLVRALELVARLPEPVPPAAHVEVLLRTVEALDLAGDAAGAIDRIREAIDLVDEDTDPRTVGVLRGKLGYLRWVTGHAEAALAQHRRAVDLVPPEPPTAERARVLAALGGALMGEGRYAESRPFCESAVAVAERAGAAEEESRARNILGSDLVALGEVEAGLDQLRIARRLAGQGGPLDLLVVAHHNLALNLLLADRRDEAVVEALAGRDLARRVGLERRYAPHLAGVAADALFRSGHWDEAAAIADPQLAAASAPLTTLYLAAVRTRIHAGRGETAEALACLAAAAAAGLEGEDPDLRAYLALAGAEAAMAATRPAEALEAARRGLAALEGSDDEASRMPLLAAATRALAELAADARAGRRAGEAAAAGGEAQRLADEAARIGGRASTPSATALAARSAAEAGRAAGIEGEPAVAAWRVATTTADAAALGALAAEARLELAAALLRSRGDRAEIEAALRAAAEAAARLGARQLAAAVEILARRGRVPLDAVPSAGDATPPAATAASRPTSLSDRELEVLRLVADGRSNGQIADVLFITRKTASAHVTHILDKLGVSNRLEAAMAASRLGLLSAPDDEAGTGP